MCLGLDGGDCHGVDDVLNGCATGEVVDWFSQPLKDRANRDGARGALHGLVGDVARVEVWEDEDVCRARDRGVLELFRLPVVGSIAASNWSGPSIAKSGAASRAKRVASVTSSGEGPDPDPSVE